MKSPRSFARFFSVHENMHATRVVKLSVEEPATMCNTTYLQSKRLYGHSPLLWREYLIWRINSITLYPDLSLSIRTHLNCLKLLQQRRVTTYCKILLMCLSLSIVNFTACQLQKIEAALKRSSFTPVCKPDGSFKEVQCVTTPALKCWKVNIEGKKIQDIDVTIHLTAHRRQPQQSKEKRIGVYPALEEDEIGNICALIKIVYY